MCDDKADVLKISTYNRTAVTNIYLSPDHTMLFTEEEPDYTENNGALPAILQMLFQRYLCRKSSQDNARSLSHYISVKIEESTISEYVYCLLDGRIYDGGIIFLLHEGIAPSERYENAQRLQDATQCALPITIHTQLKR